MTFALEIGYRHIDTAFNYNNEEAIGEVLKKWFEKGGKREDLFITSKVIYIHRKQFIYLKIKNLYLFFSYPIMEIDHQM